MTSPHLYNVLLYRSFLCRAARWEVAEQDYDQVKRIFGRLPMSMHFG